MKLLKMRLFNGVAMKSRIIFALTIHMKELHYMSILNLNHIFLDNTSKEYLQDFFTKLNLIDKKSDSGDAQYVKRIL